MMVSSINWLIKHRPLTALLIPIWLLFGKANLKQKLLKNIRLEVTNLSYNNAVIDYIKTRKASGDTIVLATASAQYYADAVARHLGLFDQVYGTDDKVNLSSKNKANFLVKTYGYKQFDYAGDHRRDILVWQVSNLSIIVNPSQKLKNLTTSLNRYFL